MGYISERAWPHVARRVFGALVCVFLVLFAFKTLTRVDQFDDPDTMNFVDVARNIGAGLGVSQSTLGFNVPRIAPEDAIPAPMTSQGPLYPLLIAAVSQTSGMDERSAGQLISVLAFGAMLGLAYNLCRVLYGERCALLSVTLLIAYHPLYNHASTTFSELTGLALMFATLVLLLRGAGGHRFSWMWLFGAGIAAGLAFATRYALAPLVIAGGGFLLLEAKKAGSFKRNGKGFVAFLSGFILTAGLVLSRNWAATGAVIAARNASTVGLFTNLKLSILAILGHYLPERLSAPEQTALAFTAFGVVGFVLARRGRLRNALRFSFLARHSYLITLWILAYLVVTVIQRSVSHFDELNARLLLPVTTVLILPVSALIIRALSFKWRSAAAVAFVAMFALIGREAWAVARKPVIDPMERVKSSPVMSWIAANARSDDLIIGTNTVYVPFYGLVRAAVSISSYPYSDYMTYGALTAYADAHCDAYRTIYIVLRYQDGMTDFRPLFGDFIGDLLDARLEAYPKISLLAKLGDGAILHLRCGSDA